MSPLPRAALDDETLCAYGACIHEGTVAVMHHVPQWQGHLPKNDAGSFRLCERHAARLLPAEPDADGRPVRLSLDGR